MSSYTLRYLSTPSTSGSQVSYSLVELPAALAKAADGRDLDNSLLATLTIKGQPTDEAVLCTEDTTYNVRSVKSSNSLLICKPSTSRAVEETKTHTNGHTSKGSTFTTTATTGSTKGKSVEVQTTLHQTLELELAIPKLDRLSDLLRDQNWSPEEGDDDVGRGSKRRKIRRYTLEDVQDLVPASTKQIEAALTLRRILTIEGYCRPISPKALSNLLVNILNTIALLSMSVENVLLRDLQDSLEKDDGVPGEVTTQVFQWFGVELQDGHWKLEVQDVVKEMGKEVLSRNKNKAVAVPDFVASWQKAVGEQYAELCSLESLQGSYLLTPAKGPLPATVTYFLATDLPLDPASRFNELFSVKQKWRIDEISPFLQDLAVDAKKRDALTLKFTRKFKGEDGQMYFTARGK